MGEEKKPEETKMEEKKPEEIKEVKKAEEPKKPPPEAAPAVVEPPPPPQEIVLKVFMHCEGCARKVRRCLKGFEGVEDVTTDCKTDKVVVKGEKADPIKVLERVQKKSHRKVELLSPIPKPPPAVDAKKAEEKKVTKPEEKKEEPPKVITVVLSVQMHCDACAQEIKRRILRMKGVDEVEPDLKSSQVTVSGVFEPPKLIEYIHKRTGKHVSIVKQEPEKKKEEPKPKTEKGEKTANKEASKDTKPAAEEKKEAAEVAAAPPAAAAPGGGEEAGKVSEAKKSEFYYTDPVNFQIYPQPQRFDNAYAHYAPAPQMFSDENPNACTVM